jgi:hypothetical protein
MIDNNYQLEIKARSVEHRIGNNEQLNRKKERK